MRGADSPVPVTLIRPSGGWRALDPVELWRARELVYFLAWRDVRLRYRQTLLGVAWALLQPLVGMAIFTVFLGGLAHLPSDGIPYAAFVYAGLVPWTFFANSVTASSQSLVRNADLVRRVYLPRLAIPLAAVLGNLVDLLVGMALLGVLMVGFRIAPGPALLLLPPLVLFEVVTAFAIGLLLAALDVRYRDVRYVFPFLVQVWLFATPVVYSASLVPATWRWVLGLNPMAGVVEGFRWALLGGPPPGPLLLVSAAVVLVTLVLGLFYFRRTEGRFADVI